MSAKATPSLSLSDVNRTPSGSTIMLRSQHVPPFWAARRHVHRVFDCACPVRFEYHFQGLQALARIDTKLELPRQLGATDTVNSTSAGMVAAVRALTNGDGVDYAFEVIGRAETTKTYSFRMLRRGGAAVAVGIAPAGALVATEPASLCTRRRPSRGATTAALDLTRTSGRSWRYTCAGYYHSTCSSAAVSA
jgi:hypothetical protein